MTHFQFETGVATHVGMVRSVNEDDCLAAPDSGLWLVADGMGGHARGDFASRTIVGRMTSLGKPSSAPDLQARFYDRLARANLEIRAAARTTGGTMGSTLVALLIFEQRFAAIWSGDSRIYLVRDGRLQRLTRDHSEVQELVDGGVLTEHEARSWPRRNVITRAIGISDDWEAMTEVNAGTIEDGDLFVLCSDGLTGHVDDGEIETAALGSEPEAICQDLIRTVLERGASDNVTLIALRCRRTEAEDDRDD